MSKYTFIDLFSGIGGFRFGFQPKGGTCVWSCEINPHARRTYCANHDVHDEGIFRDVRDATIYDVPDHDLLVAGFPCQPFSLAGVSKNNALKRTHGFADLARGTMFFQILRLLADHRPAAFLLENVPNLLNHDHGRTFDSVKYLLSGELGYHISHRIIDARPYVPQKRRRIFIAGHLMPGRPTMQDMDLPPDDDGPILAEILHPEDGSEAPEPPYTNGDGSVAERYTLGPGTWETLIRHREKHRNNGNGFGYTLAQRDGPTRTLTARYGKDGQEILISQPTLLRPRRLTPRECSRLMGMPQLRIPVSDTQAYRQLGNSVVPRLVEDIAAHITQ